MKESVYETLLASLDGKSYNSLITYETMINEGCTFHYIVDANVIADYCFPKGLHKFDDRLKLMGNVSEEYLADEQISLHSFLYSFSDTSYKFIIPEYAKEIRKTIRYLESSKLLSSTNKYRENSLNLTPISKIEDLENNLSNSISKILLNINNIKKLLSIIKEKRVIADIQDISEEILQDAFFIEIGNPLLKKKIIELYNRFHPKKIADRIYQSIATDASGIERTISINKFIQEFGNEEDKKNIFILFTNSNIMSAVMNHLMADEEYPLIRSIKIPLAMTVQQYFALFISQEYDEKNLIDREKTIKNIEYLRNASKHINLKLKQIQEIDSNSSSKLEFDSNEVLYQHKSIFKTYRQNRNAFENLGILKNFDAIANSITDNNNINKENAIKISKFFKSLREAESNLIDDLSDVRRNLLDKLISEADFNSAFLRGLNGLKETGEENANLDSAYDLSVGSDPIEGTYQHLPALLSFSKNGLNEYDKYTYRLIQLIFKIENESKISFDRELEKLIYFISDPQNPINIKIENKIINSLILLILPVPINTKKNEITKIAYNWLLNVEREVKGNKDESKYLSEIYYLLIWISRKIGNYQISYKYIRISKQLFPNDPRFYHGKFLTDYCEYEKSNSTRKDLLMIMLQEIDFAYQGYPGFIKSNPFWVDNKSIINKVIHCFSNNYAYLYAEVSKFKFDEEKEAAKDYIISSRKWIDRLKRNGKFIEDFSEYYDTQSLIELTESFFSDMFAPKEKLRDALNSIDIAIKIAINKRELTERYNKRRDVILSYLTKMD